MTIYLDVVLLENLFINYAILFTVGYILKIKIKNIRLILAALLGGIYAILTYCNILQIYSNFFMKILLSIVMIYLSFKPKNINKLFKQLMVFYLTSFVFGGSAFCLLYIIKPQEVFIKNGAFIGTYPIKIALLGGIVGFVLIVISFKIVKRKISKNDILCQIEIYINKKNKKINAMIDTGNMLKDPITRMPVIVVEKEALYDLIPNEILDHIENIIGGECLKEYYDDKESVEYISKLRVIPFSSLGRQNGMLIGLKAEKVIVYLDSTKEEVNDIIIGIYNKKINKKNKYNALLGLEIFERSEENEYITSTSK